MGQYVLFHGILDSFRRHLKEFYGPSEVESLDQTDVAALLFEGLRTKNPTHGYFGAVKAELWWHYNGRPTIFVDSFVRSTLESSDFDIDVDCLSGAWRFVAIAHLSGCCMNTGLVHVIHQDHHLEDLKTLLTYYMGSQSKRDLSCLNLEYSEFRYFRGGGNRRAAGGCEAYLDLSNKRMATTSEAETPSSRFALNLLAFISSFPDALQPGPPNKRDIEGRFTGQGFRVGLPERFRNLGGTHASPDVHIRKMHFRALRDERYKRNPDGSVRIVPVRMTLVGKDKIDPYHVELPDEAN